MKKTLIIFDFNQELLEKNYYDADCNKLNEGRLERPNWQDAYKDIERVMKKHGFEEIGDAVYMSRAIVCNQPGATLALQEAAIRYPWLKKSLNDVHFFDVNETASAMSIINNMEHVRDNVDYRFDELIKTLKEFKVSRECIDQAIFGLYYFMKDEDEDEERAYAFPKLR